MREPPNLQTDMKERFKSVITTSFGVLILLFGGVMIYFKTKCFLNDMDCRFTIQEIVTVFILGYTYLVAKDSLIEGLSLGLFKKKL